MKKDGYIYTTPDGGVSMYRNKFTKSEKKERIGNKSYEPISNKKTALVMAKHSGRHAFKDKLSDLGYTDVTDDVLYDSDDGAIIRYGCTGKEPNAKYAIT